MKVRLECSICGKTHGVDLRQLDDVFVCDCCSTECQVPDRIGIDKFEGEMKKYGIFAMLSCIFALGAIFSFFIWMDVYQLNPLPAEGMHKNAEAIMYSFAFFATLFGVLEAVYHRQIYF